MKHVLFAAGLFLAAVRSAMADPAYERATAELEAAGRQCDISIARVENLVAMLGAGHPYVRNARERARYWCGRQDFWAKQVLAQLPTANEEAQQDLERLRRQTEKIKRDFARQNDEYIDCLQRQTRLFQQYGPSASSWKC